jgi:hypothetical protein
MVSASAAQIFEQYLFDRVREAISRVPADVAEDVYAVSFYVWAEEDDPRRTVVSVSYNTNARAAQCSPDPGVGREADWPFASSAAEARWNYAYWLQEDLAVIGCGYDPPDKRGIELRDSWTASEGLDYTNEEERANFEGTLERGREIVSRFWRLSARVARRLQEEGVLLGKFGRPVPIIVHDLEYAEPTTSLTAVANPGGEAAAFLEGTIGLE